MNLLLNVDSYKASHYRQYPPNTTRVSSYVESRGGEFDEHLFFGLQAFLKAYLSKPISRDDLDEATELFAAHGLPFHRAGFEHILTRHDGYLPVSVEALPEGTVLPTHHVLLQIINTDPEAFWLTSYLETALLRAIWYPTTVATISHHARKLIGRYLDETADSRDGLPFKLHDFGSRGVSSEESAALGGLAHLVSFKGSDTVSALVAARKFYGEQMAAFSIPAAEHSTITSWGREHETDAYRNMLTQFAGPGKLVAVVSDSYDLWNAIENIWGGTLKSEVEKTGGTLVVRPDSGDPTTVVCTALEKLMGKFGFTENKKGYRVLPPHVRVIQGDGVNLSSIGMILGAMKEKKLSADNVAFGMGGALLQQLNRDTLKFAMKCSAAEVSGEFRDVYKDPVTDPGKQSKRGRLAIVRDQGGYRTIRASELGNGKNLLREVFRDGELLVEDSFADVRARATESAG
ncbi:MAG: nicotinate phosphoribosyltransferase [Polyangiaceae bacterium]